LARGFWRGVIAGSIIGGLLGAWFAPSMKPGLRERVAERGRNMRRRADHLMRRARSEMDEAMEQR
jgi:hypothetical protein